MHFKRRPRRDGQSGFTLIEALISIALVAMAMGAVMITLSQAAATQRARFDRLLLTEFAHSKLEEWVVGGNVATGATGEAEGGWNWRLDEHTVRPNPPGTLDASMSYGEVTVSVWTDAQPDEVVNLRTLAARRTQ